MAFWQVFISDEFKNQPNFSYFSIPKLKIKTDLNTDAVPYISPREYDLPIDLDFMDYIDSPLASPQISPRPVLGASPQASPRASPQASPRKVVKRKIKVYKK
jgi:hypothetical protein